MSELNLKSIDIEKTKKISIEDLEISVRAHNLLRELGIETLGDLADKSASFFYKRRNCGKKTVEELRLHLRENNLCFLDEQELVFEEFLTKRLILIRQIESVES